MRNETIKGFEYVTAELAFATTVDKALPRALEMLEGLELPDGTLSTHAFIWGMEGRQVSVTAAQDSLRYLGSNSLITFDREGRIEYPPK